MFKNLLLLIFIFGSFHFIDGSEKPVTPLDFYLRTLSVIEGVDVITGKAVNQSQPIEWYSSETAVTPECINKIRSVSNTTFIYYPDYTHINQNNKTEIICYFDPTTFQINKLEYWLDNDLIGKILLFIDQNNNISSIVHENDRHEILHCLTFQYDAIDRIDEYTIWGDQNSNEILIVNDQGLPIDSGIFRRTIYFHYSEKDPYQIIYQADSEGNICYTLNNETDQNHFGLLFIDSFGDLIRYRWEIDDFEESMKLLIDDSPSLNQDSNFGASRVWTRTITSDSDEQGVFVTEEVLSDISSGQLWTSQRKMTAFSCNQSVQEWDKESEICNEEPNHILRKFNTIASFTKEILDYIKINLSFFDAIDPIIEEIASEIFGRSYLILGGYYSDHSEAAVYGNGEVSDKVRVTFTNGILNPISFYEASLSILSETHGNVNIHYVFRGTKGWTSDMINAGMVKAGWVSDEAKLLVEIWRNLIKEMGGVQGDGLIIHYAHSLGGTDTLAALNLLTPEERSHLRIITLGSATMIYSNEVESAKNYVSCRDGVSLLDPIGYFRGICFDRDDFFYIGHFLGFPLIDHPISFPSYSQVIHQLGEEFVQKYGKIE